jgi:hypothetical protein
MFILKSLRARVALAALPLLFVFVQPSMASTIMLGQPGNWATTPIPSGVLLDSHLAPHGSALTTSVPRELAGQAAADSWVNQTAYTAKFYYVPLTTPLQPVRLCRYSSNCVPNWGSPTDDLWRAAMGEGSSSTFNRTTGKPIIDQPLGGGIPLSSAITGAPGTDKEAVICRGGGNSGNAPWTLQNADGSIFVRPDGQEIQGNCWEVWGLQPDPTYNPNLPVSTSNTAWMISWGARRTGFLSQLSSSAASSTYPLDTLSGAYSRQNQPSWYGAHVAVPGAPDSTTYDRGWGVTAAETPLLTDIVQQADCQTVLNGAADFGHAIGIQLQYSRYPVAPATPTTGAWWPANGSDGNNANVAPVEGMRLYFPSAVTMPIGLSRAAQALFHTLQKYGVVIDDQTGGGPAIQYNPDGSYKSGGALMMRSELDPSWTGACAQLGVGTALKGIPWAQLAGPIKMGADASSNPLS